MQEQRITSEASQVRIDYDRALALLEHARAKDILKAGVDLGVLDMDVDDVLYIHQLMQEYFAARCLAAAPDAERVRTDWRADRIDPSLAQVLAQLADADPLPPAPADGLGGNHRAGRGDERQPGSLRHRADGNQSAAGGPLRGATGCAHFGGTENAHSLGAGGAHSGQQCRSARPDCRRVELGTAGRSPLRAAPGTLWRLSVAAAGGDSGWNLSHRQRRGRITDDDKAGMHTVELAPFQIGKFPVTNAEWKLFMEAGGYEDERWWDTEAAKAWRRGEGTAEGPKQQWRENRKWLQDHLDSLHEYKAVVLPRTIKEWTQYAQMSDEEFEALLNEVVSTRSADAAL